MGRLDDELSRLRAEIERLDRPRHSGEKRSAYWRDLFSALERGEDLDRFEPEDVVCARETVAKVSPALQNLVERGALRAADGDGTWRANEQSR